MDTLRPGHAHRSSSYRLLSNYLDTQKTILNTLLTLLSHSHSSTSSLLAYSTSSPGILPPIRRSVRYAAFEGPLSPVLLENHGSDADSTIGSALLGKIEADAQGWAVYVGSLERFRKELKDVHKMEEEITRVKRDREILVSRLIKSTKSRPTKSDLSALASSYRPSEFSSRASLSSVTSGGSSASKEGKRASKLAEAQAELLGCEEHLRSLELQIEEQRNKVMLHGLEERFKAMDTVGRMWTAQARKGMQDLGRINELPTDLYELDSNPSLSPSQSASQFGHEDHSSPRRTIPFPRINPAGSITGSIAEEDEAVSSGDEGRGGLVIHENGPLGSTPKPMRSKPPVGRSPLGVPSVGGRPMSTDFGPTMSGSDTDDPINRRASGRRAASDIGARGYTAPRRLSMLRRTNSATQRPQRAASDGSSVRSGKSGQVKTKKRGFFRKVIGFFQGPPRPLLSGRDSPPYGSSNGSPKQNTWRTRTDTNIRQSSSYHPARPRRERPADSSSDDEPGNFVSVSNAAGGANTWSAGGNNGGIKRSSTLPVASGLIPAAPNKSGRATPTSTRSITPKPTTDRPVSRSGTVKSATSNGTVKSTGTAKKRTRPNGSISRVNARTGSAGSSPNIMTLVDSPPTPAMPAVPTAPKSQTDPLAGSLPKAPGTSIIKAEPIPKLQVNGTDRPRPLSRSSSRTKTPQVDPGKESPQKRSTTPLPPSRTLQPPLKSALRPSSPAQNSIPVLSPPIDSKPLYTVSAPGPVNLPKEETPSPAISPDKPATPKVVHRESYASTAGDTVYDTADEGTPDGNPAETSESEYEEADDSRFQVVDNERIKRLGINVAPPKVEKIPDERQIHETHYEGSAFDSDSDETAGPGTRAAQDVSGHTRRKSVRMNVPESPGPAGLGGTVQDSPGGEAESPGADGMHEQWTTRIGKMRDDTTDESEGDDDYRDAKKGLMRNSGQWELTGGKKGKKSGSVKSGRSGKSAGR